MVTTITDIPDDIWYLIVPHLSLYDFASLRFVSCQFHAFFTSNSISALAFRKLYLGKIDNSYIESVDTGSEFTKFLNVQARLCEGRWTSRQILGELCQLIACDVENDIVVWYQPHDGGTLHAQNIRTNQQTSLSLQYLHAAFKVTMDLHPF